MPSFRHPRPGRGHNAGFLTFESVVTYPFHPLSGQTVLVIGAHEHDGVHHFLIRQPHGGSYQIPDWMFDPAASSLTLISEPRLPVSQLVLLRSLVDHLIACPSEEPSRGGVGNEKAVSCASRSVRHIGSARRADRHRAPEGGVTPAGAADGSGGDAGSRPVSFRQEGGGQ